MYEQHAGDNFFSTWYGSFIFTVLLSKPVIDIVIYSESNLGTTMIVSRCKTPQFPGAFRPDENKQR